MHRNEFPEQLIERLANFESESLRLSVYLPMARRRDQRHKNEIRLKNRIKSARRQLREHGLSPHDSDTYLKPLRQAAKNGELWREPDKGLAVFVCGDFLQIAPLPFRVDDLSVVGPRFHLKPVLAALQYTQPFCVLALSQNDVKLFKGDVNSLTRIDLGPQVPRSLTEVVGRDLTEPRLQHHTGDAIAGATVYHGHGAGKDDLDAEKEKFLRALDRALQNFLRNESAPIFAAGVESLLADFRRLSGLSNLADTEIPGNAEHLSGHELHERVWPIVKAWLDRRKARMLEELTQRNPDASVSFELDNILCHAIDGRIDVLCVAADTERWGHFDDVQREIVLDDKAGPDNYDLLDRAAIESYLRSGEVYLMPQSELPRERVSIAGLRY